MNKLYVICGFPFSGKTFLRKKLVEKFGYYGIDLDEVKFELYGSGINDDQLGKAEWDNVYEQTYKRIEDLLVNGKTVVYDSGNFTKHERSLVRKIADKLNIETMTIFIDIPREVVYKRLIENRKAKDRFDVSDTDFENTIKEMQRPEDNENHLVLYFDEAVDEWISKNIN